MQIVNFEMEKYRKFDSRYDLNYWYQIPDEWLKVDYDEFQSEIDIIVCRLTKENIRGLIIDTHLNKSEFDLSNLQRLSSLEYLSLGCGNYINTKALDNLQNLKSLYIYGENNGECLDLSKLRCLKRLIICNSMHNIVGIENLTGLETLKLQKFMRNDLQSIKGLSSLTALELIQPRIVSLKGIEELKNMQCLTLFYCSKLTSLEYISELTELKHLQLRNCSKLTNYTYLGQCKLLKYLSIMNCGPIGDLQWMQTLNGLKFIGLVETNVLSGDVSPMLNVPDHRFTNKKNFNYYQNSKGIDIKRY